MKKDQFQKIMEHEHFRDRNIGFYEEVRDNEFWLLSTAGMTKKAEKFIKRGKPFYVNGGEIYPYNSKKGIKIFKKGIDKCSISLHLKMEKYVPEYPDNIETVNVLEMCRSPEKYVFFRVNENKILVLNEELEM